MIYIPRKDTLRDRICKFIAEHGAASMRDIKEAFQSHRYDTLKEAVFQLASHGALIRVVAGYQLTSIVLRHYCQCEAEEVVEEPAQIAAPADPSLYSKPWSGKYSIANVPRREPLRELSMISWGR